MPLKYRLALAGALLLHLTLAAHNLTLPGLHPDEAQEAALQAGQVLAGRPVSAFRSASLNLAGLEWPLMVQDYIGSLNVVLALPFFALLGANVFALRLMAISISLIAIAVTYRFAAEIFGRRPAALAVWLLAAQPSYLFWMRQGVYVTSITVPLAMGMLWALATAWRYRSARRLALAGLLAGLGVYAKLSFLWIIGGAVAASLLVALLAWLREGRGGWRVERGATGSVRPLASSSLRFAIYAALPFLAGISPLLLYNLITGGTLASVGGNLTTSFYGVNNSNVATNLATRVDQLRAVLAGRDHLWYLGGSFGNPWAEWVFGLSLAIIVAGATFGRRGSLGPVWLALLTAVAFLQSIFTVSGLFPTHFALLMPLFPLLIALGVEGGLDLITKAAGSLRLTRIEESGPAGTHRPAGPKTRVQAESVSTYVWLRGLLTVGVIGLVGRDVWVDMNYHRALEQSGGLNVHSDAIYRLSAYLDEQPAGTVVALDWGYAPAVRFLTGGRVTPEEIFGYGFEADETFDQRLAAALENPATLYVLHWPQETIFPRQAAFAAAVAARGLQAVTLQTFSRRDGAPIFDVVRVENGGD